MGESELVLDSLTVDDALRLLGATGTSGAASASGRVSAEKAPPAQLGNNDGASGHASSAVTEPEGGDWRQTLRATGASPDKPAQPKIGRFEFPTTTAQGGEATAASRVTSRGPLSQEKPAAAILPFVSPLSDVSSGLSAGVGATEMVGALASDWDSLAAVAAHVATCTRCPLSATATHPVPGEGNPTADLMCVGEAPGATEDQTGRPFIGAAGQLLTKILEAIQLSRDQVYICNVLKHRPPGNRNPLPEEVTACSPYLVRQIELVRPKVIIALGTFAAQTLLNSQLSLGKLRGQIHRFCGVPLIVTYHPAALLRNPSWKRPTWEDVQLARRILDRSSSGA